jgi:hypothetical protein
MKNMRSDPLFAAERKAAAMLDLRPAEFLRLVGDGVLPSPTKIGIHERWDMEQLQAIVRGSAVDGLGEVNW